MWQTEMVIMGHFLLFYTLKTPQNKNFQKMKKNAGDIIISKMCTKNHNHIRHSSWDTKWDRQNFLLFWAIFCPFTPLTTQTIKILKKSKKASGDVIILQVCTKNHNLMLYASWNMECDRYIFIMLCHFLPFNPTIDTEN